jgi:predicted ribosomally synthesized peptide with nif11-like leader
LRKYRITQPISEEQLSALLAKLKEDAGLQVILKGAQDLDAAVALAKDAGFDVEKADWLKYQESLAPEELSDEQLEGVTGGVANTPYTTSKHPPCNN